MAGRSLIVATMLRSNNKCKPQTSMPHTHYMIFLSTCCENAVAPPELVGAAERQVFMLRFQN